MLQLTMPFTGNYPITQTFAEHVARAKQNGWCSSPGPCPGGTYYYGGIDWGMPTGTPLFAAHDGSLSFEAQNGGYGNNVRLKFVFEGKQIEIVYGHMKSFAGSPRQAKAGEMIGYSDNTGFSSGPHLHFELRVNGAPTDSTPYFVTDTPAPAPNDDIIGNIPTLGIQVMLQARTGMNLRNQPGSMGFQAVNGNLPAGERAYVVAYEQIGSDLWAWIGGYPAQCVAVYYQGTKYIDFVEGS